MGVSKPPVSENAHVTCWFRHLHCIERSTVQVYGVKKIELTMQNKKLYIILGIVILLIVIAAFIAGRMINSNVGTVGLGGPNSGQVSISMNDITPAPELPATRADVTGSFVERKDNAITVQAVTFGTGVGGVSGEVPMDENSGITLEIVVTSATRIYKDVTEFPAPVNGEIHNVQQAAEEGTLDELNTQCFLSVGVAAAETESLQMFSFIWILSQSRSNQKIGAKYAK